MDLKFFFLPVIRITWHEQSNYRLLRILLENKNTNYFFPPSNLHLYRFSKQNFLSEVTNPFTLQDHSPSFKEYTGSKNNRFLSPAQASKNRIQPPSKVIYSDKFIFTYLFFLSLCFLYLLHIIIMPFYFIHFNQVNLLSRMI